MRELPAGTVTFLFTDIEGSTKLLRELGDGYAAALAEHRQLLRQSFAAHRGAEVDTQGDAFFVAFADPRDAVDAAAEAQSALAGGPIRVRMGLHTAEPTRTDEGYVGLDVHLGARIAACGHGGQILLSRSTRELVDGDASDLGEHRLKDFDEPVWIFQLGDGVFPPLKTSSNTHLPRPASSFVGREREVRQVTQLLRTDGRLLTLTGPGGSGKTRLAIEAASELVGEFRNGVFWIGLAAVQDAELVLPAIAQTLGAQEDLAAHIAERESLLLLDNLEQVVDAAPDLARLVEACRNVRLLVTSRELLRVRGEVEYEVLPLADPDAVELLCLRSGLAASATVGELCRRLDNMPLAVELAAARTKALSPEQILERLSQRLDLFKGGRDADPRQRTLRATIEWSHDLLDTDERRLFARLAVFAGGCTLEAAEAVCEADLDTLQSLVEKSLVRRTGERFWMLETIREYALERLDAAADVEAVRRRHAEFFLALAESANLSSEALQHAEQRLDVVTPEEANLRAAIDGALSARQAELAGLLVNALELFWVVRNPFEGMRRTQQVLEAGELPPRLRAQLLRGFGSSANPAGEPDAAEQAYKESFSLFRELGDEAAIAHMLMRLGASAFQRSDLETARALLEDSVARTRRLGSRTTEAMALSLLGHVAWSDGDRELALERVAEGITAVRETGFAWWEANLTSSLADYNFQLGRLDEAESWGRETLRIAGRISDRQMSIWGLAEVARAAAVQGNPERAGRLWGAIEAEEAKGPVGAWESERGHYETTILGERADDLEHGRRAGRALSLEEAIDYALADA